MGREMRLQYEKIVCFPVSDSYQEKNDPREALFRKGGTLRESLFPIPDEELDEKGVTNPEQRGVLAGR